MPLAKGRRREEGQNGERADFFLLQAEAGVLKKGANRLRL